MFDVEIQVATTRWSVPVAWIKAVIQTESSWNQRAYRAEPQINDASRGLMQVLYQTAQRLGYSGAPDGLYDVQTNINLGTLLLSQLRTSYGDDFRRVYSAYNSGNPDLWQTSSQVAANVARALSALLKYSEEVVGNPMTLIVLFILFWMFKKR